MTRSAQLEKLEHKLEDLVNVLATSRTDQAVPLGRPSPLVSHPSEGSVQQASDTYRIGVDSSISVPKRFGQFDQDCDRDPQSFGKHVESSNRIWNMGVNVLEGGTLLDRFRTRLAPNFPFVVVPETWSVMDLFDQKPFLCRVVMTVSSYHNIVNQRKLVQDTLEDICRRTLLGNERSIDILQGMLVFAAW